MPALAEDSPLETTTPLRKNTKYKSGLQEEAELEEAKDAKFTAQLEDLMQQQEQKQAEARRWRAAGEEKRRLAREAFSMYKEDNRELERAKRAEQEALEQDSPPT